MVTCEVTGSRRHSNDLLQGGLEIPCIIFKNINFRIFIRIFFALNFYCCKNFRIDGI